MKIAVIGCGTMGSAFARKWKGEHQIRLFDRFHDKAKELSEEIEGLFCETIEKALHGVDVVLLATKPSDLAEVSRMLELHPGEHQILMSILAGVSLASLKKSFPQHQVIRLMPNLAITCSEGVIGVVDDHRLDKKIKEKTQLLLQDLGLVRFLSESKLDALTALTGSGPAFIFAFVEAIIDAGIFLGFTQGEAYEFAMKMIKGSVTILETSHKTPQELQWQVASPKGTTIAGLKALEDSAFKGAVMNAFIAAYQRAVEIHKESGS